MKKILIVEDEKFIRDLYVLVFTKDGFDVDSAIDGEEAINKVRVTSYDCILLDIMLPKKNGIEVLKVIRSDESIAKTTPVFMISNLGQEDIMKETFAMGANGYLLKAEVTPSEIVNEVKTYLESHTH